MGSFTKGVTQLLRGAANKYDKVLNDAGGYEGIAEKVQSNGKRVAGLTAEALGKAAGVTTESIGKAVRTIDEAARDKGADVYVAELGRTINSKTAYLRCRRCGQLTPLTKEFFGHLIGGATIGMGMYAWLAFIFAGTGFALAICVAIMIGGAAIMSYSKEIIRWISSRYDCEQCGQNDWEIINGDALIKDAEMSSVKDSMAGVIEEMKKKYQAELERQNTLHQQEKDKLKAQYEAERQKLMSMYGNDIRQKESYAKNTPCDVNDLRELFWKSLQTCTTEFDVYVPFLGYVFKNRLLNDVVAALKRGVIIKIRCGLTDDAREEEKLRQVIQEFCSHIPVNLCQNLHFKLDDSHAKLVIVDEECYILSSMNFLSYTGEDFVSKDGIREKWDELGELSVNKTNLLYYRQRYFAFENQV